MQAAQRHPKTFNGKILHYTINTELTDSSLLRVQFYALSFHVPTFYRHLIKSEINPLHIVYCNFDEPELQDKRIDELLKEYSRLTDVDHKKKESTCFWTRLKKLKTGLPT